MPDRMKDDRNTQDDAEATGCPASAEKSPTLADLLAAAPRNPKNSLTRFIRENANTLRKSRDEGVSWEAIMAAVHEHFADAAQISVETYVARFAPAKVTRELRLRETEVQLVTPPPSTAAVPVAKAPVAAKQAGLPGNPYLPRRPTPKGA